MQLRAMETLPENCPVLIKLQYGGSDPRWIVGHKQRFFEEEGSGIPDEVLVLASHVYSSGECDDVIKPGLPCLGWIDLNEIEKLLDN